MIALKKMEHDLHKERREANDTANQLSTGKSSAWLKHLMGLIQRRFVLKLDSFLHNHSNGPYHLSNPKIARAVLDSWLFLHERKEIHLYAICVMSNHIHVVAGCPEGINSVNTGKLIQRTKIFTGRTANVILQKTGEAFWEGAYFDTTIRQGKFNRVIRYVLMNPVKAKLVTCWEDWPYTWLNPELLGLFREREL